VPEVFLRFRSQDARSGSCVVDTIEFREAGAAPLEMNRLSKPTAANGSATPLNRKPHWLRLISLPKQRESNGALAPLTLRGRNPPKGIVKNRGDGSPSANTEARGMAREKQSRSHAPCHVHLEDQPPPPGIPSLCSRPKKNPGVRGRAPKHPVEQSPIPRPKWNPNTMSAWNAGTRPNGAIQNAAGTNLHNRKKIHQKSPDQN